MLSEVRESTSDVPRSKLWDVMDCLSHVIKVMDEFAYYFDPDDFGPESDEEDYKNLLLEDDEPIRAAFF